MNASESEAGDEYYDELEPGGKRSEKDDGYILRNVLKLPRTTTYTTQALYEQIIGNDINLEPEYQRDVVWPEPKQVGLIDSILRNFYIPPVIFVSHQHSDGSETKTCVDGKQRLTSIQRFMDGLVGHICLSCAIQLTEFFRFIVSDSSFIFTSNRNKHSVDKDSQTGDKYWYKPNISNQSGRSAGYILPDKYRRLFANKQIVCIEYQDLPDFEEREIFQRVQLGMALTPAEKLQVINTPMTSGWRRLDWDRSRGGDFRCIAQALYCISKYPSLQSVGTVLQIEKWLHNPVRRTKSKKKESDDDEDLTKDEIYLSCIHDTFRVFSQLVSDPELCSIFLQSGWRISPVEFITICLLISVEKDKLQLRALADKLARMREAVREEHVDIRMNARVAKTLLDFVKGIGPQVQNTSGMKRKLEEEDVAVPPSTQRKRTETLPVLSPTVGSHNPIHFVNPSMLGTGTSLPPPPRPTAIPDRLAALHDAKKSISNPTPPRIPPTAPAALRNAGPSR
ncbi:uncharacterized protein F5891DRAFT_1212172 [Suillus fuscotomentosus]|uniref:GmrSD restriction endonucleases N-terminal domain-containing protein n=1 Tax=Suillus fuscotomentosus TaxID=1912939 RepID=A0AAD4HP56_9AGAM|nr:uncharacterized protein F5891DRAFT_1212172 [Suillus fuscotomentosus]KAG1903461.1 hypothetical protein F5891DRAFT_1212172 [Suillus fuscotomentosus]